MNVLPLTDRMLEYADADVFVTRRPMLASGLAVSASSSIDQCDLVASAIGEVDVDVGEVEIAEDFEREPTMFVATELQRQSKPKDTAVL